MGKKLFFSNAILTQFAAPFFNRFCRALRLLSLQRGERLVFHWLPRRYARNNQFIGTRRGTKRWYHDGRFQTQVLHLSFLISLPIQRLDGSLIYSRLRGSVQIVDFENTCDIIEVMVMTSTGGQMVRRAYVIMSRDQWYFINAVLVAGSDEFPSTRTARKNESDFWARLHVALLSYQGKWKVPNVVFTIIVSV